MTRRIASVCVGRSAASRLLLCTLLAGCSGSSDPGPSVASVEVTPTSATRIVGETVQLGAAVKDAEGTILSGQSVAWSSSAQTVASVSASGLVTANGEGTATITAASGSRSGTSAITVLPAGVALVEVTPSTVSRRVGESAQLTATAKDARGTTVSGQNFSWSSSNASVASVSTSGLVTAHAIGSATITAASGARSGIATVTVNPEPIGSISVAPVDDTLIVGETTQLSATMRDANNNVVTGLTPAWSTSAVTVATVNSTGLVTGVTEGLATITVSQDGLSATSRVVVWDRCSTAIAPKIAVGQTVNGSLSDTDCRLTDGTFTDGYDIVVDAVTPVEIEMTAGFDTYLLLLELVSTGLVQRAINDDISEDNTNSRISFTLQPNAQYYILANSFEEGITGNYQLKVTAVGMVVPRIALPGKPGKAAAEVLLRALRIPR